MPIFRLLSLTGLLMFTAAASASSLVATTDTLVGALSEVAQSSSDATSSLRDNKVVLDARDDAAAFVASQGQIRGVQLEAALAHIRQQVPALQGDDLQLASAILSL